MRRDGEQRQGAVATESVAPGTLTALLREVARAPEEERGGAWEQALQPGAVVGRFELVRELGRGGFGVVWEARDRELGRAVAFKAVRAGAQTAAREQRLLLEAEAAARLAHPNIVMLYDLGRCEHGPYLVLERLHGETLAERLRRSAVAPADAVRIASEIAKGLSHAHGHGVVHRDLKPANVFLCQDGQVKVLDFGLSQAFGRERAAGGTSGYMAPEQEAGGEEDARADVYALGATLHEMLAGERPPAPLPRGIPSSLARLVVRCLSADPAARPADGAALLEELARAERSLRRPREAQRWALRIGLGVALGAAAAGIAVHRLLPRGILPGPDGRVTVAVADFANETGEKDLDSVSGLLITSLEQSEQLRVLTRGRLFDLARQAGRGEVERIDEPLAREVGRKGEARVLLLASIRKLGGSYVVDLRALDPVSNEYLFTASARSLGKEGVFDLVDRLGQATRRKLGLPGGESGAPPVASITTGNAKAWELFSRARDALDRARLDDAVRLARAAVEADPEFGLAHYQLAVAVGWNFEDGPGSEDEYRRHLEAAERLADRLPTKERLSLRAMRASLDNTWEEAMRLRDQLAAAHPLDKEAAFYAGDVRFHMESFGEAIPYFQRALQLDPSYLLVRDHLLVAVERAPHPEAHLEWLRSEASRSEGTLESHARLRSVGIALLAAGAEGEAVALLRKATERGGIPWPPPRYAWYLASHGRAAEAEALLRAALAGLTPTDASAHRDWVRAWTGALMDPLMAQGRIAEMLALGRDAERDPKRLAAVEAFAAEAAGSLDRLRQAIEHLKKAGALDVADYSVVPTQCLLGLGATSEARKAAETIMNGPLVDGLLPVERHLSNAIYRWATGDLAAAEAAARDALAVAPHARARLVTSHTLGLIQRARGDCTGAVASLEAARQEKMAWMFSLEHPRILHELALCYEQTGDAAKARERVGELLSLWEHADPDLPRLAEAKALRRRLGAR